MEKQKKKKDGRSLWKAIDWKGEAELKKNTQNDEQGIQKCFREVFQSVHTTNTPIVDDIVENLNSYHMYVPVLDDCPTMSEVNYALKKFGKGAGVDGLTAEIAQIIPSEMKDIILLLIQRVFYGKYPLEWTKQILHRKGRTFED